MTSEGVHISHKGLSNLPSETVLEYLLPSLSIHDILAVSQLNTHFYGLASDETLWTRLVLRDHAFDLSRFDRIAPGWSKRVYQGLVAPDIYVWGSTDNGRLGFDLNQVDGGRQRGYKRYIDRPFRLKPISRDGGGKTWNQGLEAVLARAAAGVGAEARIEEGNMSATEEKGLRVVDIHGGGAGYFVRDSEGGIWAWGELQESSPLMWSPFTQYPEPTRLLIPCKVAKVSYGSRHVLLLDEDNLIWELNAFSLAFYHTSPALTAPAQIGPGHIKQISAGRDHSVALDTSGRVHIWYPFSMAYNHSLSQERANTQTSGGSHEQRSLLWGTVGDVVETLESIPPGPPATGIDKEELSKWKSDQEGRALSAKENDQKVIEVASGYGLLVALRANGEVWYRRVMEDEPGQWNYVPQLSYPGIKHISARSRHIISHTDTTVYSLFVSDALFASSPSPFTLSTQPELRAQDMQIPTASQNESKAGTKAQRIVQVEAGVKHTMVLTSTGELWTWGENVFGQLGIGESGICETPQRVRFSQKRAHGGSQDNVEDKDVDEDEPFVLQITAGSAHAGALVLGGEQRSNRIPKRRGNKEQQADVGGRSEWAELSSGPLEAEPQAHNGPMACAPGRLFRIGFAGRGSRIGQFAQRGRGPGTGRGDGVS